MFMTYSDTEKAFLLVVESGESSVAVMHGWRRLRPSVYYSNNVSIAKNFISHACKKTRKMLNNYKEHENKASAKHEIKLAHPIVGKYMPHQIESIQFALRRARTLCADDPGTGKTITAGGWISSLHQANISSKTLIVCPASMRITWQREMKLWFGIDALILRKDVSPAGSACIINFEQLKRRKDELLAWAPDSIVVDEFHLAKNPLAQRSEMTKLLIQQAKRSLFLTGTPFPNSHKESFFLFNLLSETDFSSFALHEHNLRQHMKKYVIRHTREQVLDDLPERQRQYIILSDKGFKKECAAELDALKVQESRLVLDFETFSRNRREAAIKKLPQIIDFTDGSIKESMMRNEKVVVVCYHQHMIEVIADRYNKKGIKTVVYYGEQTEKQKQKAIDEFQAGDAKIIVVAIRSGGTGLTLTAASKMIFCEFDYVPANIEQMEMRVYRKGQKNKVLFQYLVVENSYDEHTLWVLKQKQRETNSIIQQTRL